MSNYTGKFFIIGWKDSPIEIICDKLYNPGDKLHYHTDGQVWEILEVDWDYGEYLAKITEEK